ncbi:MAG: hypothetical protein IJ899_11100 [Blautia sp.]|nr:hypothetical protein [Blautia sp.]
MEETNLTIILILLFVLILLPVMLAKITGSNPMEMFFGGRVRGTAFDKQNKEKEKKVPKVRNGSRQDLIQFLSLLTTFARKRRFPLMLPGTVAYEGETATLSAIMVTRAMVIGFNCFGYGGTVTAGDNDEDWVQLRGEEKVTVESPTVKNAKQKELVEKILAAEGRKDIPVEIFGVFTNPDVTLIRAGKANCFVTERVMEMLGKEKYLADKGYVPAEVDKLLAGYKT